MVIGRDAAGIGEFRDAVRKWVTQNRPRDLAPMDIEEFGARYHEPAVREWLGKLYEAGLLCATWPTRYGGSGRTDLESAIVHQEFARARVPLLTRGIGELIAGPAILGAGTEEQKRYFVPRIVSGEDLYAQGFSEPDSGSDLASLRTRGDVDGDVVKIFGQKVWTSFYAIATMLLALVRTEPDAPRHRGLSLVIVPIPEKGSALSGTIEFRPLKQLTGRSTFAETFLDGARAPLDNVIGGRGGGWKAAQYALAGERAGTVATVWVEFHHQIETLTALARDRGMLGDDAIRRELAAAYARAEVLRHRARRTVDDLAAGASPEREMTSIDKVFFTEHRQRVAELAMRIVGPEAAVVGADYRLSHWQHEYLQSRSDTIWGGTSQIQRNIIGERVLGLPREPVATTAGAIR